MRHLAAFLVVLVCAAPSQSQTRSAQPGQVLVAGTVQDEAAKAAVLAKLRAVYGADMVVDQIAVGLVATPANWISYVDKLITAELKQVSRGQLVIDGSTVSLRGEVPSEAVRRTIANQAQNSLNPTYTINTDLRVSAPEQGVLDATLANRTVEFESGKATLTDAGRAMLDEMAAAISKLKQRRVELIGHTDNVGLRAANQALSHARAEAVKAYLGSRGIDSGSMTASGMGPDRPLAGNDSADGRARNRRIQFRLAQ